MTASNAGDVLVEMLVASPSMLRKVRQDHRPDASGHCRSCRAGADGSGRVMQCSLWLASEAAKRLLAARGGGAR